MTQSFEQEIKEILTANKVKFKDHCDSFKKPDFTIYVKKKPYFYLEAKEKRQRYNMHHWQTKIAEENLFILDDLTVRKCLAYAPISGVLVRDNPRSRYALFTIVDLALMPRQRVNRPIQRAVATLKGKWLIDLQHGFLAASLNDIFTRLRQYNDHQNEIIFKTLACYGNYPGENIIQSGATRQPSHWIIDRESTK